jgi:transcriptional regulator with GAF, ATPase, and Fis domain
MAYINNIFDTIYNLIIITTLIYLIGNFVIKEIKKNKNDKNQTKNYIKLYFDKLFIIKLIRLVKENLILSSSARNITSELIGYFGLNSVVLYKNVNSSNSEKGIPHFVALDASSLNSKIDLNQHIEACYDKFYDRAVIIIKGAENDKEVEYMVFPLRDTKRIIGALTLTKACDGKFESSDLDTIHAICAILELALTLEIKFFKNDSNYYDQAFS